MYSVCLRESSAFTLTESKGVGIRRTWTQFLQMDCDSTGIINTNRPGQVVGREKRFRCERFRCSLWCLQGIEGFPNSRLAGKWSGCRRNELHLLPAISVLGFARLGILLNNTLVPPMGYMPCFGGRLHGRRSGLQKKNVKNPGMVVINGHCKALGGGQRGLSPIDLIRVAQLLPDQIILSVKTEPLKLKLHNF